jgi:hypothetical protein
MNSPGIPNRPRQSFLFCLLERPCLADWELIKRSGRAQSCLRSRGIASSACLPIRLSESANSIVLLFYLAGWDRPFCSEMLELSLVRLRGHSPVPIVPVT